MKNKSHSNDPISKDERRPDVTKCRQSISRDLKEPHKPGDRGACAKESRAQGSE